MRHSIVFVTGNQGKLGTARDHMGPLGIGVEQADLKIDEIQAIRVEDVARRKAQEAFQVLGRPLIVEDSGLYFNELNGYPGAMIKHLTAAIGPRGLAHVAGLTTTRRCRFDSCLVYVDEHGQDRVFSSGGQFYTVAAEPVDGSLEGAWSP